MEGQKTEWLNLRWSEIAGYHKKSFGNADIREHDKE